MEFFLLDNGELNIMDLSRSHFTMSYNFEISNPREILFTKNDSHLLLVESHRVRLIDWQNGSEVISKKYENEIQIVRSSNYTNHFGVANDSKIEIWDIENLKISKTLNVKKRITNISFSPFSTEIVISPTWNVLRNRIFIFDYQSGKEKYEIKGKYLASYDNVGQRMVFWQNNAVPGLTVGTPVFGHQSFDKKDYQSLTYFDGKQEKNSDVGFYLSTLHLKDKLIGAGGYRGFSVFDYKKGGKVFTTKKTKRDRSSSGFSAMRDYAANAHYLLNDDLALINAYGDNINQIYSATENKIVGYIFVDAGGDYAVVSRDGRFDGTPESSSKLFWSSRKSSKQTSLESTFSRGFTPGLLQILLAGNEVSKELVIDDAIENVPVVQLTKFNNQELPTSTLPRLESSQRVCSVEVNVLENNNNVSSIKLFQNNKLVGISEQQSKATFEVNLTNTFGDENYFYTVAISKDGIESKKKKMVIKYSGKTDEKPKLFLVSVGVNEYKNPKYNLNYAVADADAFKEEIKKGAESIFDNIFDLEVRNSGFTKTKISEVLNNVRLKANEQDLLIFYYAGHGVMSEGIERESEFFLVPHDVTQLYGRDEMLYENAISAKEIQDISKEINAQKQIFIIDACQSASALEAVAQRGIKEERAIAQLARSTGTFWITASGSKQFATEFESLGHGVFTYALLEGLAGKADGGNHDKKITVKELSAYVESRVPELSEEYKGKPQFPAGYSFGNDFPIVVYE
ncbi:caspase family protein [Fulvivirga lutimaris]|uniref:caspase family protein n=1 Tax=Fulvivirga lutimaris TaxID=1819566 RepID=UPI0012BC6CB8|nr:caspase family protein [Fulvivirga lutimaris]MTI38898.1 hypothetical protein [Fulvivirga lutimaris]